jgi:hypothetical protein
MAGSSLDPPTSTNPLLTDLAKPSGKTGRFGKVSEEGAEVGRPARWAPERLDPDLPVPTPEMPRKGVRVARRRRLLRVAGGQVGLFTVAQAAAAGLDRRARHHHLSYGNWRRTDAPDVFRIAGWPPDPHERLRCWLLWAGPGAKLTAWTALGLAGLIGSGPRVPVDVEVPFGPGRVGRRRRSRLRQQLSDLGPVAPVNLHPAVPGGADVVSGMSVRAPAEAMCAAVDTHSAIAMDLAADLLERGVLSQHDLSIASHVLGCHRIAELFFLRRAG